VGKPSRARRKRPSAHGGNFEIPTLWTITSRGIPRRQRAAVEEVTLRTARDLEPYLREPLSPGWKPVYALRASGRAQKCRNPNLAEGFHRNLRKVQI